MALVNSTMTMNLNFCAMAWGIVFLEPANRNHNWNQQVWWEKLRPYVILRSASCLCVPSYQQGLPKPSEIQVQGHSGCYQSLPSEGFGNESIVEGALRADQATGTYYY